MFKIDIEDRRHALTLIHNLITDSTLTKPECTLFGDEISLSGLPEILKSYDADNPTPPCEEFIKQTKKINFSAISCVCATDPDDLRRVTLTYMPDDGYVTLSFPMAHKGLNTEEKELLKRIRGF